ncbi:MAG TPA: branched-chain amino acid transaminase [Candidatus Lustribacter sp.]
MQTTPPPTALADATTVWLDGQLQSGATVALHGLTHALHYGSSVFEGIRLYPTPRGPAIFRLRDHIDRLYRGARTYGLEMPFPAERFCEIVVEVAKASKRDAAYIRPLVFFGGDTVRLAPAHVCETHVLVAVLPFSGLIKSEDAPRCAATVSPIMKSPSAALPSWVKAGGHYTNSILALSDALARGFDEAILLNDRGNLAEGSGENLFVVCEGVLTTNDGGSDILEGITRGSVLEIARELGIPTKVRTMTRTDLAACDEAFFTGTAAEVVPIVRIDDRIMSEKHPITDRLRTTYADMVRGNRPAPENWLRLVS